MFRPRTIILGALVGIGFWIALTIGHQAGASAVQPSHPAPCCTHDDWYVNDDETDLKPEQTPFGMLFDGPSLIHHALTPVTLADAPEDGAFGGHLFHGSMPLFKLETHLPYSTINKTSGGYWSSKIATGPGSQAIPVAHIADLAPLAPYTDATVVYSFGVGYAHDTGNKALVSWVAYGGHKYDLGCPPPSPSTSPSASASPTSSPVGTPTPTVAPTTPGPTTPPPTTSAPTPASTTPIGTTPSGTPAPIPGAGGVGQGPLPKTGSPVAYIAGGGVALIAMGFVLLGVLVRRRRTFVA